VIEMDLKKNFSELGMEPLEWLYAQREELRKAMEGKDKKDAYVYPSIRNGNIYIYTKWPDASK